MDDSFLNLIVFLVVRDLSSCRYCYSDIIDGCIMTILRKRGKSVDDLSEENLAYIKAKAISILNTI